MSELQSSRVGASVIIPAYDSHATARATLESLRNQTFRDFETILIDSGPGEEVACIAADFPEVRYRRSKRKLLPHEARNVGTELARSDVLVFTDPDIVAAPDWLEKLVAAYGRTASPVSGAVASLRSTWLELGTHIAKFDLWLPGGDKATVPIAASVNFLCSRELLHRVGGFDGREMIGDTVLSWDLLQNGQNLHFQGDAIVYHDHRTSFQDLLRERLVRGADFGRLRSEREAWSVWRTMAMIAISVLPLRLVKLVLRSLINTVAAGCTLDWLKTFPVIVAGHGAWLTGEITQYCKRLQIRSAAAEAKPACM